MDIRVMSQSAARGANPKLAKEGRGSRGEMSTVLMMLLVLAAHGACSEGYVKNVDVMSQQSPVYVAFRATRNDYSCGDNALISEESECKAAATALGKLPYHESGAWENAPRGCLFDVRGTFYNTHATGGCFGNCVSLGMTPICVRRGSGEEKGGEGGGGRGGGGVSIHGPSHNTSQAKTGDSGKSEDRGGGSAGRCGGGRGRWAAWRGAPAVKASEAGIREALRVGALMTHYSPAGWLAHELHWQLSQTAEGSLLLQDMIAALQVLNIYEENYFFQFLLECNLIKAVHFSIIVYCEGPSLCPHLSINI